MQGYETDLKDVVKVNNNANNVMFALASYEKLIQSLNNTFAVYSTHRYSPYLKPLI